MPSHLLDNEETTLHRPRVERAGRHKGHVRTVRVIRDSRDATKDTWLPETVAAAKFARGELILVNAFGDTWDYAVQGADK